MRLSMRGFTSGLSTSEAASVSNVLRSDGRRLYEGGEWARSDALYPLPHY